MTALSAGAYPAVADRYVLLPHGASFGEGYGPIVVAAGVDRTSCASVEIVTPGPLTTANACSGSRSATAIRTRDLPFDEVLDEVVSGRAEAGLVIHEGQLTYADAGLHKLLDLGDWWQAEHRPAAAARARRRSAGTSSASPTSRPSCARRSMPGSRTATRRSRTRWASAAASTPRPPTSSSRCTSTT